MVQARAGAGRGRGLSGLKLGKVEGFGGTITPADSCQTASLRSPSEGNGAGSPFHPHPIQLTRCCPAQAARLWSQSLYETDLVLVFILPRKVPESQGDISHLALILAPPDPLTPTLYLHSPCMRAATSFLWLSKFEIGSSFLPPAPHPLYAPNPAWGFEGS